MLANNTGVFKDPQDDPEIDHLARVTVKVCFEGEAEGVSELTQDYKWPFQVEDGKTICSITIPAGDVRVLFFSFSKER